MVDAVNISVATVDDIPANNLQVVLGSIYGKAQYAANEVGAATFKADQANTRIDELGGTLQYAADTAGAADFKVGELTPRVDAMEGTLAYAADGVGTLDYHLRQIAALVGYTMPA